MEVMYNSPVRKGKRYVFKEPKESKGRLYNYFTVSSISDCLEKQERVLKATQSIVDYLSARKLPQGVEGSAEVKFYLWTVTGSRNREKVYELGFPDILIQTNYGFSQLFLSLDPWEDGCLTSKGGGLAEEVIKAVQSDFEKAFGAPDSKLELDQEKGGNRGMALFYTFKP